MISTGAFQIEMDASNKQPTLAEKFAAVWEKKNAKAARAGGVSLMALSLAACGSSDDTETAAVVVEDTTTTVTTVTPVALTLTTATDTISGADLTSAGDTITATSTTMAATDAIVDTLAGDGDTMNITLTANNTTATIANIETVNFDWSALGAATINLAAVSGAETVNINSTKTGYLGGLTVTNAKANTVVADAGIDGTVSVTGVTAGTITADYGSTVGATASTASGTHSATVNANAATTVTVTNFADATVVAPAATAITVDDNGVSTGVTNVTIDAAAVTFTTSAAIGTLTINTEGDDVTAATVNDIGKALTISGTGDFTLNSTASAEVINNTKTSGTLTVKNSTTGALDVDEVAADTIWLTGVKTASDTVASGADLKYSGAATDVNVTVAGAGTADAVTATITSATADAVVLNGVETLTLTSAAPSVSGADMTAASLDTNGNKLVILGTNDVTITAVATADTGNDSGTIDASGLVGALTITGTETDEALDVLGGTGSNVVNLDAVATDVTYTGGAGADTVTADNTTGDATILTDNGVNSVTAAGITTGTTVVQGGSGVDTITIGGSANITTGTINIQSAGGNDAITVNSAGGTLAGATIYVDGGAGDDSITHTAALVTTAASTLTVKGGDGTDTLTLADNTLLTLGTIDLDVDVIQLSNTADLLNATFQASDMSGKTFTMKADGTATTGFTVIAAASTSTIDLSTLTIDQTISKGVTGVGIDGATAGTTAMTITGTLTADTISGGTKGDTITGGNGIDTITAGAGADTIILTETTANQVADEVVLSARATNGKDTIKGFKVGTDNINLVNAEDTTTEASISIEALAVSLVTGAAAYAFATTTLDTTDGANIAEIVVTLSSNGDLDTATDGTELFKALSTSATLAATSITLDTNASGYMIAYQDGNAYLYAVDAGANATLTAAEMTLVAVLEDITAGALTAGDFVV